MSKPIVSILTALALAGACASASAQSAPAPQSTSASAGGSNQLSGLSGCMNQWVFNGVWRVRVLKVGPATRSGNTLPGYALTVEIRNGSDKTALMSATGVPLTSVGGNLFVDDGNTLTYYPGDNLSWTDLYNKSLPPSAGAVQTIKFTYDQMPQTLAKPQKWLFQIDPAAEWQGQPKYTTRSPSLRIDLTCDKGPQ